MNRKHEIKIENLAPRIIRLPGPRAEVVLFTGFFTIEDSTVSAAFSMTETQEDRWWDLWV